MLERPDQARGARSRRATAPRRSSPLRRRACPCARRGTSRLDPAAQVAQAEPDHREVLHRAVVDVEGQPQEAAAKGRLGLGLEGRGGFNRLLGRLGLRLRLGGSTRVGSSRRPSGIPALTRFPSGGRAHGRSVRSRLSVSHALPRTDESVFSFPRAEIARGEGYVSRRASATVRCRSFQHLHTLRQTASPPQSLERGIQASRGSRSASRCGSP